MYTSTVSIRTLIRFVLLGQTAVENKIKDLKTRNKNLLSGPLNSRHMNMVRKNELEIEALETIVDEFKIHSLQPAIETEA